MPGRTSNQWCISNTIGKLLGKVTNIYKNTVDGRNPAPVEGDQWIGSLSHYLQGFIHFRWLAGFLPSTVNKAQCFLLLVPTYSQPNKHETYNIIYI